jgi:hypothetical protein
MAKRLSIRDLTEPASLGYTAAGPPETLMHKRTPTESKSPGKRPTRPPRLGIPFWLLVHFVLGLILVVAGALKLYELTLEAQDESTPTLVLLVFAEVELLSGLWMAGWFDPHRTRWWAAAAFAGLALASLSLGLVGKCSCGCFGSLSINPWITLVFDLGAVAALLGSQPTGASEATFPIAPLHWMSLGAITLLVVAGGRRQADLVTVAGRVMADGRPLDEATLTVTGESGRLVLRTDHEGHFRLGPVRPGLYAVSAPQRRGTPTPGSGEVGRTPMKRSSQRSRQQPSSPRPTAVGQALQWIEISHCSDYDKLIAL